MKGHATASVSLGGKPPSGGAEGIAAKRYERHATFRTTYLNTARRCAALTHPYLLPPEGWDGASVLETPWQSVGSTGLNNLAAKLLLLLLPPNTPFFRFLITDEVLEKLGGDRTKRGQVEEGLRRLEKRIMQFIESSPTRAAVFEALKHLIVSGNVLLHLLPKGGVQVFPMDRYVVKRSPTGELLEFIIRERVSPLELTDEGRAAADITGDDVEDIVDVYTHGRRTPRGWTVHQEIKGKLVMGTVSSYPHGKLPYLALQWSQTSGRDWSHGYVEQFLGDMLSLEGLTKALVEGAAVMSKLIFLVNPNSTIDIDEIAAKESGGFVQGMEGDIVVLQADKYADMQVVKQTADGIERRVAMAFLMGSSIQRDAERVTAEEFRFMAQELESALGGTYTTFGHTFQRPLVEIRMHQLQATGSLPELPRGAVSMTITTGLEALGRGNDLQRLKGFLADLTNVAAQAQALDPFMHLDEVAIRLGTGWGVDTSGLVRTPEERADYQSDLEEQAVMSSVAPEITKAAVQQRVA